jgi:hypothetical protein
MTKKWNSDDYSSPSETAARDAELEREARRRGLAPWQLAAERAVPTNVVRGLVEDAYRSNPVTGGKSMAEKPKAERGTGYRDASPLGPQPGINYVDALCDAQDARDRAEKIAELQAQIRTLKGE